MKKIFVLVCLLSFGAQADFKQLENSELEFIPTLISKKLKDCLYKESIKEVTIGRISNKTSQHIDKDVVTQNLTKSLSSMANVSVANSGAQITPSLNLVIQSKISEKPLGYESTYEITFHVAKADKTKLCDGNLILTKNAVFKQVD